MNLCGRADLVRLMRMLGNAEKAGIAELTGYSLSDDQKDLPGKVKKDRRKTDTGSQEIKFKPRASDIKWIDTPFLAPVRFEFHEPLQRSEQPKGQTDSGYSAETIISGRPTRRAEALNPPPLEEWPRLLERMAFLLQQTYISNKPDMKKLMHDICRGQLPASIPLQRRRRWPQKINVVSDRSIRFLPFRADQREVIFNLKKLLGEKNVNEFVVDDASPIPWPTRSTRSRNAQFYSSHGTPVLILGDCGGLEEHAVVHAWWNLEAKRLYRRSIPLSVLTPAPISVVPATVAATARVAGWEDSKEQISYRGERERQKRAEYLLRMVSFATAVEPGLLRQIRRLLPPEKADATTEIDVWTHEALSSRGDGYFTVQQEKRKELQNLFLQEDAELRKKVLRTINHWHLSWSPEVWFEELSNLPPEEQEWFSKEERETAAADLLKLARAWLEGDEHLEEFLRAELKLWLRGIQNRTGENEHLWRQSGELSTVLQEVAEKLNRDIAVAKTPAGYDPRFDGKPGPERLWSILQVGANLRIVEHGVQPSEGSLFGVLRSTRTKLHSVLPKQAVAVEGYSAEVYLNPQTGETRLALLNKPAWADLFGRDDYGIWAAFSYKGVSQRLRWIAPGLFRMGSQESEKERDSDERQHPVTLTEGFWLFDTPVTQGLWEAIAGENPSRFKSPDRPVEQVSWEDCQAFIHKLNGEIRGLNLSLPTEAQWEYACRAGTPTATYAGDPEIKGDNNAPLLDEISWYGGNSGVGFDLDDGWDSAGWPAKQYDHQKAGTHPVALKKPNPWGLYDMLGNVYEWCADWYGDYSGEDQVHPNGPPQGTLRVLRGGSWGSSARYVRAAFRINFVPGFRDNDIGFRCARVQDEAASEEGRHSGARRADEVAAGRQEPVFETNGSRHIISTEQPGKIEIPGSSLQLQTDQGKLTVARLTKPDWAEAIGRDRFGLWVCFKYESIVQRLRWIPPGQFRMGSPENETERDDDERQHLVTLSHGFWLFDTPVTQTLYGVVMGNNPSRFRDDKKPVEQVSWEACQTFIQKLNGEIPGLNLSLPTEAQWEYACRAGTSTPFHTGENLTTDQANYDGNYSYRGFPKGTYRKQTTPVSSFAPNPWGLYDMLGNVYEWCEDWYGDYSGEDQVDPEGPVQGTTRVIRGGSWNGNARYVRAASRLNLHPGIRDSLIGFRCARVQEA